MWRLIPAVRRRERTRFLFFLTLDLLLSLSQTFGLVAVEALILTHWGAAALPLNFVAASVVTVLGSLIYALGVNRAKNDRYFIYLHLVFAAMVFGLAAIAPSQRWAYLALGCVYYLSFSVLNNHYWTFTGDFFDTLSSKRLFPIFIFGNSLGGFLGGAVVSSGWLPTDLLLQVWGAVMLLTAVLLRVFRRSLRRWGPLELEEADETSLDGIRNSFLYLRQSKLGRSMVVAFSAMVGALFISQYLYSQVFSQAYPDADQLAQFFGRLLAITNLLEIVIEGWLTPFLIRTLGVATANLLHPMTTMLGFLALSWRFEVGAAILARMNRETLDNAMGQPIRNLVYNALPDRFRGRLRAFFEGIVVYSGMALAGVFLTVSVDHVPTQVLTWCGLATSIVYLWANSRVRSAYLKALVAELQAGRLELAELGNQLATYEVHRLGQIWEALTGDVGEHPNPVAVRFARTLAERGVFAPLLHTARQGRQTWLRCTCLQALGKEAWRDPAVVDLAAQAQPAELRLAALEILGLCLGARLPDWLSSLTDDNDPRVRALALSLSLHDDAGAALEKLCTQAQDPFPGQALPALLILPSQASEVLVARSGDPNPEIRAACIRRLGQIEEERYREVFLRALNDPDSSVKVAGLQAMAGFDSGPTMRDTTRPPLTASERELQKVIGLLWSPSAEVRTGAARLLARQGESILPRLTPCLTCEDSKTVIAALDVLTFLSTPRAREQMAQLLRQRTQQIWYVNLAGLIVEGQKAQCAPEQTKVFDFLIQTLHDASRRDLRLAFETLNHLEDPRVMRSVEKVLRFANLRARSDALEVLSNLGDREASNLLVLLLEDAAWAERTSALPPSLRRPASPEEVLSWCQDSRDRWLRLAAEAVISQAAGERDGEFAKKEGLMERLLVLRKVPLFAHMSLDQLEAINQLLKDEQYLKGETIFHQGELGEELYILVEGGVRIVQGKGTPEEVELNRMAGISYFGEMSILDDEPRSASVVCYEDSRLLVLKGDQLKELIMQMPEISFEIFKVLSARLRMANVRVGNALKSGEVKVS